METRGSNPADLPVLEPLIKYIKNKKGLAEPTIIDYLQKIQGLQSQMTNALKSLSRLQEQQMDSLVRISALEKEISKEQRKRSVSSLDQYKEAQDKLDQLEQELSEQEAAVATAKMARDEAAALFSIATSSKAKTKNGNTKAKINARLPELNKNKSKTEDLYNKAVKKRDNCKLEVASSRSYLAMLNDTLSKIPEINIDQMEEDRDNLKAALGLTKDQETMLLLEIEDLSGEREVIINKFNFTDEEEAEIGFRSLISA
jgi:multidrug efflux pump subunit AcrA (membrane-fusion protein)